MAHATIDQTAEGGSAASGVDHPGAGVPGRGERWVPLVLAVVLAVQVGVPASLLTADRPAQFGWQMYSGVPAPATYRVEMAGGEIVAVDPADHLLGVRLDLSVADTLPDHLCAADAGVRAVEVTLSQVTTTTVCP